MSYFGKTYSYSSDELPSRAKTVYMYLKDRSDVKGMEVIHLIDIF